MPDHTYSVWLGCRASIWAHRGYRVVGARVECSSIRDARRIVRESIGGQLVTVKADGGIYYYRTRADRDADDSGVSALAVIDRTEDMEA